MITSAPEPWSRALIGRQNGQTICDNRNILFCPSGTCYTGVNGYVGCCTAATCLARSTCLPYTASVFPDCDNNTGGCTVCSDPQTPFCATITNPIASQFAIYCATQAISVTSAYSNLITGGSIAPLPTTTYQPSTGATASRVTSTAGSIISPTNPPTTSSTASTGTATPSQSSTPNPLETLQPSNPSHSSSGLSGGAIAGIAVGVVAAAFVFVLFLFGWRRKRSRPVNSKFGNLSDGQRPDSSLLRNREPDEPKGPAEIEGDTQHTVSSPQGTKLPFYSPSSFEDNQRFSGVPSSTVSAIHTASSIGDLQDLIRAKLPTRSSHDFQGTSPTLSPLPTLSELSSMPANADDCSQPPHSYGAASSAARSPPHELPTLPPSDADVATGIAGAQNQPPKHSTHYSFHGFSGSGYLSAEDALNSGLTDTSDEATNAEDRGLSSAYKPYKPGAVSVAVENDAAGLEDSTVRSQNTIGSASGAVRLQTDNRGGADVDNNKP